MEEFNGLLDDMLEQSKSIKVAKFGKIVEFVPSKMKASVMPLPSEDNSLILNVPIAGIRGKDHFIYYPLKPGDNVVLLFFDNDVDDIKLGGDSITTERQHDVSDCVALGGWTLLTEDLKVEDEDSICIQNFENTANIVVKKQGEIEIKTQEKVFIKSEQVLIESDDVKIEGFATYNGSEIAVKGDSTSDGATIV